MSERRYRDGEVRRILELAARRDAGAPDPGVSHDGLTLGELQSIAHEVGISAGAVARAAAALDTTAAKRRTSWGMPIEVTRTVHLPRAPTDAEWERLVAELRSTFRARGRVSVHGGLREWSNGNLHASLEPTDRGYRLRMGTLKGGAAGVNALGFAGVAAGAAVAGAAAIAGAAPDLAGPLLLGLSGLSAIVANLIRLPRWARLRDQQMTGIEARLRGMLEPAAHRPADPVPGEDAS